MVLFDSLGCQGSQRSANAHNKVGCNDLETGQFPEEQRRIFRAVALSYRRARRVGIGQHEAVEAAICGVSAAEP
jgi:hypothetical protein